MIPKAETMVAPTVEPKVVQETEQAAAPASAATNVSQPSVIVISSSLQEGTRCQKLALKIKEKMEIKKITPEFLDLKDYPALPLCDGKKCYADPTVQKIQAMIKKADIIIFAFPVYNDYCSAPAKNLMDLTGKGWENKVVGLIATAGSARSYSSPRNVANSLGYFNCRVVSKYVYADKVDFPKKADMSASMHKRLDTLVEDSIRMAAAFQS